MKVVIKGKTTDFDVESMSKLSEKEFEALCLTLSTFKQIEPKFRDAKIKEVYGNIKADAAKSGKPGKESSGRDLCNGDAKSVRGDIITESGSNDGRKNIKGSKDNAKL